MKTTVKIIALALIWSFALMSFAQNSTKLTDDQIVTNRVASKLASHDRFHGVNVQVDDRIARL
jgi:hypothetical protein